MCGIAGIFYFQEPIKQKFNDHDQVLELLKHRGPDFKKHRGYRMADLYHTRLKIIDLTDQSNQPFEDAEKQQGMVFNGEIFNYKTLSSNSPEANSDVAALFHLMKTSGKAALNALNGFFAFGIYDSIKHNLLIARDRLGIKPIFYYKDTQKLVFASELKALLHIIGPQELNANQIYTYFRLNYCAGRETIFKNVYRLLPGSYIEADAGGVREEFWYSAPKRQNSGDLKPLLHDAVKLRLQADVPLGAYLSGGLDSSIISAIAKIYKPDLNTFSIGFKDQPFLDESYFSEKVAGHIQSNHHSFQLSEDDFLNHISDFLKCIDEPFADSSAFNFYLLSLYTHKKVKVALSGDGADELFKGYHKHRALLLSNSPLTKGIVRWSPDFMAEGSRESAFYNRIRKLKKFRQLVFLSPMEKQQFLASISQEDFCKQLILPNFSADYFNRLFACSPAYANFEVEDTFDLQTVLSDDMLVKADRFSMRHGLEIRNPFLDVTLVEYALNLQKKEKITFFDQKIILKKTFSDLLPKEIVNRKKKGFELPLRSWLCGQLRNELENNWLDKERLTNEGWLNVSAVERLKDKLFSNHPGDSAAQIWAIVIFENWMQNFKTYIKTHA